MNRRSLLTIAGLAPLLRGTRWKMDSPTYTLMQPQTLQAGLGFRAYSVRVDNPSALQLYFPDANVTIRPGTVGAIVQLPGSTTASCQATLPTGAVSNGLAATLVFSEQKQPTVTGSSTLNVTSGGPLLILPAAFNAVAPGSLQSIDISSSLVQGATYELTEFDIGILPEAGATQGITFAMIEPVLTSGTQSTIITADITLNPSYAPYCHYLCNPPRVWLAPKTTSFQFLPQMNGGSGIYQINVSLTLRQRV